MKKSEIQIYKFWDNKTNDWFKPTYEAYKWNLEDVNLTTHWWAVLRTMEHPANVTDEVQRRFEVVFWSHIVDRNWTPIYSWDLIQIDWSADKHEVKFDRGLFYIEEALFKKIWIWAITYKITVVWNKFER